MNDDELAKIFPLLNGDAQTLLDAMNDGDIRSPLRQAAFLAQVGHESGDFHYWREIGDGHQYEGRKDLGNIHPGDGKKFPGRGPIQITGYTNYWKCGLALSLDLIAHPELLEEHKNGCKSAVWFWNEHALSPVSERCTPIKNPNGTWGDSSNNFFLISKAINGINPQTHMPNGMSERCAHYSRLLIALGAVK